MQARDFTAAALLLVATVSTEAQEPSGRLDLDSMSALPQLAAVGILFGKSSATCPEDHAILRMSGGQLRQHQPFPRKARFDKVEPYKPIDDETYRIRISTNDCRVDMDVRQQVRAENTWVSLRVPALMRPSHPVEERQRLQRELVAGLRSSPAQGESEQSARIRKAFEARRSIGSLAQGGGGVFSTGARFEEAPPSCVEAIGHYALDQGRIAFYFAVDLPGDLNRFVIERVDLDDDRSRLHFTRGDCRYEITIAASILHGDQWIARSIAPYVPTKTRPVIRLDPDSRPPWLDRSE